MIGAITGLVIDLLVVGSVLVQVPFEKMISEAKKAHANRVLVSLASKLALNSSCLLC
jgi:hypothetical protein